MHEEFLVPDLLVSFFALFDGGEVVGEEVGDVPDFNHPKFISKVEESPFFLDLYFLIIVWVLELLTAHFSFPPFPKFLINWRRDLLFE